MSPKYPPATGVDPEKNENSALGVTLPPIDATPEEIAKALFKMNPEGEPEKTA